MIHLVHNIELQAMRLKGLVELGYMALWVRGFERKRTQGQISTKEVEAGYGYVFLWP